MRDQHPDGELAHRWWAAETLGARDRQVQEIPPDTGGGSRVKAPLIYECYANLECKVVDMRMAATYNIFILEVVKAWIDPQRTPSDDAPLRERHLHGAGGTISLPSKMK